MFVCRYTQSSVIFTVFCVMHLRFLCLYRPSAVHTFSIINYVLATEISVPTLGNLSENAYYGKHIHIHITFQFTVRKNIAKKRDFDYEKKGKKTIILRLDASKRQN